MDNSKKMRGQLSYIDTLRTIVAIVGALLIVCVLVFFVSSDPLQAMEAFLTGPFSSLRRMGNVVETAIPLIFTGLAVMLLQRSGFFNLAMEGAFFIGSAIAAAVALTLPLALPAGMILLIASIAGALAGAIICGIPALLQVKCQANVLVTSLMLNYICLHVGLFLITHFFQDPSMNTNVSFPFPTGVEFITMIPGTRINTGLIVVVVAIFLVWLLLNKTAYGFKVTMVGKNPIMAQYSGMKIGQLIITSSLIGGLLAGLGGAVDLLGMYPRFQYTGLTGYGWDGILVAIVARHKAQYVPIAALLLAYMRIGADVMSIRSDVPAEMIMIIQAIIIVLISAQAILGNYKKKLVIQEARISEQEVM